MKKEIGETGGSISIAVRLYTYRPLKNGTYPLLIQVLYKRKKRVANLPIKLRKGEFNEEKERMDLY
ncbi:MAG: hypothetical protein RR220_08075 [Bacteroidaceae bacterium]